MWIWSKLSGAQWQDAWEERFYGNANTVISEIKGGRSIRVEVYTETEAEAEHIQSQFGGSIRKLREENWVAMSSKARPPVEIRDQIVVTGESDEAALDALHAKWPERHLISIPADMAFGTGDHPTTSNCLDHLLDIAAQRESQAWDLLDLGTGSGVLAIAARMLGASGAFACDYDPLAVKVAAGNVQRNGVDQIETAELDVLKWQPDRQWDVIMANVFCDVLQATFPKIHKALPDGGDVVISGILEDQWEPTRAAAENAGLVFDDWAATGKWVTARGRKAK